MDLERPAGLALVALVPLLLAGYVWLQRRRRRHALRVSSLVVLREAVPRRVRWRHHVPVALVLAAVGCLGLASARPTREVAVPLSSTSILLAMDVSASMCASDVAPNRLTAAQAAARAFVEDQPDGARIGLVTFAGFATLVVPPTTDHAALGDAIDRLTTSRGTAIGLAILVIYFRNRGSIDVDTISSMKG